MDWSIQILDSASSTQDIVKDLAWGEAPEGIVVQALEQTDGRGRHGREWVSQKGNLFFSVLLRPDVMAQEVGSLALVAGLSLYKVLEQDKWPEVMQLKWPNDLLLSDKKCAGILMETELAGAYVDYVALGLGVNIVSAPKEGAALGGEAIAIRDDFLEQFDKYYKQWKEKGFSSIKEDWLGCAHEIGAELSVKIDQDHVFGVFAGLDDVGNLLLDCNGSIRVITAGEIYLCS